MIQQGHAERSAGGSSVASRLDNMLSTYRFRFLGLGFISAWIFCSWETMALFPMRTGASINSDLSWLYSAITVILAYLAIAFIGRKHEISERHWLYIAAPIVTAASTLIAPLNASLVDPSDALYTILSVASGVMTGCASACLVVLWCCLYKRLSADFIEVIVPASSIVMIICLFIVPNLSGVPALVAVASLPIISGFMLILSRNDILMEENDSGEVYSQQRPSLRWFIPVLAAIVVVYAINSFLEVSTAPGEFAGVGLNYELPAFVGNLFAVAFSVVVILYSVRVDMVSLVRFTTPLLICAIALFCGSASWMRATSLALSSVVESAYDIILTIVFVQIARNSNLNASLTIGLMEGAAQIGVLIGNIASDKLIGSALPDPSYLATIALVLICILATTVAFIPSRRHQPTLDSSDVATTCLTDVKDMVEGTDGNSQTGNQPPKEDALDTTCRRIAKVYLLSEREFEVLCYLAHGRSQPYIREALFLSKNTIASYVKHVYAKLGVHTRQELIDLVEAQGN